MIREIRIVDYDPVWPARFRAEAELLRSAFEPREVRIEHIGSTSVPGLGAKPVIDILVGADALSDIEEAIPSIEALGYEYVPDFEDELPERRYFRKNTDGVRSHHIHAVALDSSFWKTHIAFRDYLRSHPEVALEYRELKTRLAGKLRFDLDGYTVAKAPFIERVLEAALPEFERRRSEDESG